MAANNRVIWDEGLFVRPQHFQQETRYLEHHTNHRIDSYNEFLYGLTELEFDESLFSSGKLAIVRARGVMPDGTIFDIPTDTPQPLPLHIQDSKAVNQVIYLALPIRTQSDKEIQWPESQSNGRYVVEHRDVKDLHSRDGDFTTVNTAKLHFNLMLGNQDRSAYTTLAIAQIKDKNEDSSITIYDDFYPTSLSVGAIPRLKRFVNEITSLMHERAKNLAERIGSPGQAGVADVTDFLLLQALNRMQPKLHHLSRLRLLHPERLYETFVEICGELSTFQSDQRFAATYHAYKHENPKPCFTPLEELLRKLLGGLMQPKAVPIPVEKQSYGNRTAVLSDPSLIQSSDFVLAVKARMHLDQLRQQFQQQTKVSSLEKLSELVNRQLPGIPLQALPIAPRQLPYHAGFTYFELDSNSEEWHQTMSNASGFGFHIAGEFPELELEFWALRKE
jgi:type VI secretion system protein ImpJ